MYDTVVLEIDRPDRQLVDELGKYQTASLYEVMGQTGMMDTTIQPLFRPIHLAGPALTVCCPAGDNLMVHKGMTLTTAGDVLLVDAQNTPRAVGAVAGGMVTVQSLATGIAGLVTNGSVRDVREIREANFPVFCQFISVAGASKSKLGSVNVPIVVGGIIVRPGDIIIGDDDGVVVVPPERAEEVLEKARLRTLKERELTEAARRGEKLYDLLGCDKTYEELHIREIKGPIKYWQI